MVQIRKKRRRKRRREERIHSDSPPCPQYIPSLPPEFKKPRARGLPGVAAPQWGISEKDPLIAQILYEKTPIYRGITEKMQPQNPMFVNFFDKVSCSLYTVDKKSNTSR